MSCARPANRFSRKSPAVAGLFSWLCPASFSLLSYSAFFFVMFGLEPNIHKHKALAHDMHAESSAFRQRFVPQPVLRSSWQQLVMFGLFPVIFGLDPNISLDSRAKHGNDNIFSSVILGQAQRVPGIHRLSGQARTGPTFLDKNKYGSIIGRQKNL